MDLQPLINLVASLCFLGLFFWLRTLDKKHQNLLNACYAAFSAVDARFDGASEGEGVNRR